MTQFTLNLFGEVLKAVFRVTQYVSGSTAVQLIGEDGAPLAMISVNLPESKALPQGVFYAKHWSENAPVLAALLENGLLAEVPEVPEAGSGFVDGIKAYRLADKVQ